MKFEFNRPRDALAAAERRIERAKSLPRPYLNLSELGLAIVPPSLFGLEHLTTLYLSGNKLRELPDLFDRLHQLDELSVGGNLLKKLPVSIGKLSHLRVLALGGNPELGIPAEIVETKNARRILDYYFRIQGLDAAQALNEFKLILVGRGGVGKTTLVHRLVTDKYKEFKRTPGVKITQWPLKIGGGVQATSGILAGRRLCITPIVFS